MTKPTIEERIKILTKALEFYAEERHFEYWDGMITSSIKMQIHPYGQKIAKIIDCGETAREALTAAEKEVES